MTSAPGQRIAAWMWLRGGFITLVVFALYAWLAPSHVVNGDNAEFVTLGAVGGVAHPSGYPLYVLWLRSWSWLPLGSVAHTAAIATAVIGAAQVAMLHAAARAWGARTLAASLAVAIFAAAPIVLRTYTEAEVFALNGLVAATLLWLAAPDGPVRGHRRVLALALVAGLGLANHHTCVLVAPLGLYGAWRGVRESTWGTARTIVVGIIALVLGLTPYAYLLIAPDSMVSWRRLDGLGDLVHHFLRLDYGALGTFGTEVTPVPLTTRLGELLVTLGRGWLWLPLGLGLFGLGVGVRRPGPRAAWVWLLVSVLLAGPILATRFAFPHDALGLYVVHRFYLLPMVLLVVPVAVGLDEMLRKLGDRVTTTRAAIIVAPLLALVLATSLSLGKVGAAHSPAMQRSIENVLRSLPANAVLIGRTDNLTYGGSYVQDVLGLRRDVTVVAWPRLTMPGNAGRLDARLGFAVESTGQGPLVVRIADAVLASGRPLFVEFGENEVLAGHRYVPFGAVARIVPTTEPMPGPGQLVELNRAIYQAYVFDYPPPSKADDIAAAVHDRYAAPWLMLRDSLAHAHLNELAGEADAFASQLAPR